MPLISLALVNKVCIFLRLWSKGLTEFVFYVRIISIMERLIPTGKRAVDGRRVIFRGEQSGFGFDLQPDYKPPKFKFAGRAKSDRSRVLVEDQQGLKWDVSLAVAKMLIRP